MPLRSARPTRARATRTPTSPAPLIVHRRRRRHAHVQQGRRPGPRHGHGRPQRRILELHPGGQLQRPRQLHVPGQRRHRQLQHGHDVDHGRRGQRRPGLLGRLELGQRGRRPVGHASPCTDVDGDSLDYSKVGGPAHGSATVDPNGDWSYTPAANYNGPDSFTFKANDGTADSNTATVSITVDAVNDVPVCSRRHELGQRGRRPVGHALVHRRRRRHAHLHQVAGPAHGTATVDAQRRVLELHAGRQLQRPRQLHLQGQRRHRQLQPRSPMSITVDAVNDAPVCSADTSSGNEDAGQSGTVTCTDADGDSLDYSKVGGPGPRLGHGRPQRRLDLHARPPTTTAPTASRSRPTTAPSDSNTATMSITVDAVNDKPVCSGLTLSTDKNVAVSGTVSCTDPENDPLTLQHRDVAERAATSPRSTRSPVTSPTRPTTT